MKFFFNAIPLAWFILYLWTVVQKDKQSQHGVPINIKIMTNFIQLWLLTYLNLWKLWIYQKSKLPILTIIFDLNQKNILKTHII